MLWWINCYILWVATSIQWLAIILRKPTVLEGCNHSNLKLVALAAITPKSQAYRQITFVTDQKCPFVPCIAIFELNLLCRCYIKYYSNNIKSALLHNLLNLEESSEWKSWLVDLSIFRCLLYVCFVAKNQTVIIFYRSELLICCFHLGSTDDINLVLLHFIVELIRSLIKCCCLDHSSFTVYQV